MFTVWTYIVFLSEYSADYPIPTHIRYNPSVQAFNEKVVELALAVDDYYMTKKKIMTNDITTRVVCLLNEKGCTLQEAIDNQLEYAMDLYKQCTDFKDKINADSDIASDNMSAWMDTAFNAVHSIFHLFAVAFQIHVTDDQTLRSAQWDEAFRDLISKANTSVDPWDL